MRKLITKHYILITCLFLTACIGTQKPAGVSHYGAKTGAGSAGIHTVTHGETLWTISQRYRMSMQDIAELNKLKAPFYLAVGRRLRLPPPREYRVRAGDTLYEVSRLFGVSTTSIARQNHLTAPYVLTPGQILRLPSVPKKKPAEVKTAKAAPVSKQGLKPPAKPAIAPRQKAPKAPPVKTASVRTAKKAKITAKTPKRSSSRFLKPVEGNIISGYGPKKNGLHNDGINIKAPKGAPVRAAENGVVVYAGDELKGSGNLVLVRHSDRWMSAYAHMDRTLIKRGQTVKRGQTIGTVGSTGSVSEPQLHFELRRGTEAVNPKRYVEG